jgi:Flp pilus assembly pilin Flp
MREAPSASDTSGAPVSIEREGVFIMIERFLGLSLADEAGQTMAEYAVVLGVITIAVVVTLGLLSTAIQNTLNNVISVI